MHMVSYVTFGLHVDEGPYMRGDCTVYNMHGDCTVYNEAIEGP